MEIVNLWSVVIGKLSDESPDCQNGEYSLSFWLNAGETHWKKESLMSLQELAKPSEKI